MAKPDYKMCHPPHWSEPGKVNVMAIVGAYAMVKRPHCQPFVVETKYLTDEKERD